MTSFYYVPKKKLSDLMTKEQYLEFKEGVEQFGSTKTREKFEKLLETCENDFE
jgi:hypothetical protein